MKHNYRGAGYNNPVRPVLRGGRRSNSLCYLNWAPIDKNRNLTVKKDFGLKNGFSVESVAGLDEMPDK